MKSVPEPSDVRVIAVRLTNWVGDTIMNTPFLTRLRETFKEARIVAYGRTNVIPLLQHHPDVDEVVPIDDRTPQGRGAALKHLRSLRADLGFALPNSLNSALFLWRGRVRNRIGYNRDARRLLLTHPIPLRPQDLGVHEVRYYMRLLSPWGVTGTVTPQLSLHLTNDELVGMTKWLADHGAPVGTPVIGVNPAAFYGTAKRWLPERYAEVARRLATTQDAKVFVTGLPTERDVAQAVCDAGGSAFHNAAGEMKLRELMAFIAHCSLYLTNDSGAMHVAAALNTPLVAVFGSTDWVTTAPYTENARIVRSETECAPCLLRDCPIDHRCMTGVTVDMVLDAASALLRAGH